jgi:hypothetical protein
VPSPLVSRKKVRILSLNVARPTSSAAALPVSAARRNSGCSAAVVDSKPPVASTATKAIATSSSVKGENCDAPFQRVAVRSVAIADT